MKMIDLIGLIDLKWLDHLPFLKKIEYKITTKYGNWKVLSLESEFGTVDIPFEKFEELTEKYIRDVYLKNIRKLLKAKADYYLLVYKELQKEVKNDK